MQNTSAVSWTVLTAHTYVFQFHEWKAGNVIISDTDGNIQMYPADFLWHNWKRVQSEWLTCLCEMQSRCHTPTIKGLEMCNSWSVALEKFEMIDLVWIKLQVLWWTPGWCVWLVFKGIICGRIKAVFVYRFSDNRVCMSLNWVSAEPEVAHTGTGHGHTILQNDRGMVDCSVAGNHGLVAGMRHMESVSRVGPTLRDWSLLLRVCIAVRANQWWCHVHSCPMSHCNPEPSSAQDWCHLLGLGVTCVHTKKSSHNNLMS